MYNYNEEKKMAVWTFNELKAELFEQLCTICSLKFGFRYFG